VVVEEEEEEEEEEGWEGKEAAPQSALADGFFEEGGKMAFKMRPNTLFHVHISTSVRWQEEDEEEDGLGRLA
jgi:hypothetical protein